MPTPLKYSFVAVVIIGLLCLLVFGNPQWGKAFYLTHLYVFPNEFEDMVEEDFIEVSWVIGLEGNATPVDFCKKTVKYLCFEENYSGEWRVWYGDGTLAVHYYRIDGMIDEGKDLILYHGNGNIYLEQRVIAKDKKISSCYNKDGKLMLCRIIENGTATDIYDPARNIDQRKQFQIPTN